MRATRFDYDASDVHLHYDVAREMEPETRGVWVRDLRARAGRPEPTRVLDLGCGTGRFTRVLREAFPGAALLVGADPARGMLGEARPKASAQRLRLLRARGESLPFASAQLDLVVLSMVFHHLKAPGVALHEVRRVLRAGGISYIRTPTPDTMRACSWAPFFPRARAIAAETLPTAERVRSEAQAAGLAPGSQGVVRSLFARSPDHLVEKIARRGISSLKQLDQQEFDAGLAALRAHCAALPPTASFDDDLAVLVFQKP